MREYNFYLTQLTGVANELDMLHLSPEALRELIKIQYPFNQILTSIASEEYRAEIRGKKDMEANLLHTCHEDSRLSVPQAPTDHGPRSLPQPISYQISPGSTIRFRQHLHLWFLTQGRE